MPVVEEGARVPVGTIAGMLINPETGAVEGFFVKVSGFLHSETLFLSANDIRHWGLRVHIADEGCLFPVGDVIRCQSILESGRVTLGQPMLTEDGVRMGRCIDVQFSTTTFQVEWLFPRRWFKPQHSIAFRDVLEVRPDAVVVRSAAIPVEAVPAVTLGSPAI